MEMEKKIDFVEGKVDWKGRAAVKQQHGGMRTAFLILATFGFENMATLALAVNLITYFNGVMHLTISDAANQLTNFSGTGYILSIGVAILADSYLGRFKTLLISASFEFLGLALLTVQAHYPKLQPPVCNVFDPTAVCEKVKGGNAALLFIALYMLAAGAAGVKATLPSHGADQFEEKDPKEAQQMSSFFNMLLLAVCVGGVVSLTLIVWIQDNKGWDWGFGISTIAMFLGVVVFFSGLPMYRIQGVQGTSALIEIIQVYVAAIRNFNRTLPADVNSVLLSILTADPSHLYEIATDKEASIEQEFLPHRPIYGFLDKAAVKQGNDTPSSINPWKLCRVTQVENAKILLGMVPIFLCTIIMTLCLAQLQTFSIQQGVTMDTKITKHFKIPPASLPIIPIGFLVIIIPVYDKILVPLASKYTGIPSGITHLQRIGVGLVLSCVSMGVAGIMEVKRKDVARHHNMLDALPVLQPLPISVFWLSFQYFIFGIADMFTYVGLLEFFYSEAPKGLKSISTCFLWSSMALGYFFSTVLVKVVNAVTHKNNGGWLAGNNINRNHLNYFYWLLSGMSFINFFIYLGVSMRYKYRPGSPMLLRKGDNVEEDEL